MCLSFLFERMEILKYVNYVTMAVKLCVLVPLSSYVCVLVLVHIHVQSHEGHWSLRPPHDLSYFYRAVSLASPQTPPVGGESSRSG